MKAKYRPLVVATLDTPDLTAGAAAFVRSFAEKVGDAAQLVLATEAAKKLRDALFGAGGTLCHSTLPDHPHLRAADAVSRVARDQPDRPTLVVHARYTVFQHADVFGGHYRPEAVSVAAEGGVVAHDPLHREQWDVVAKNRSELIPADRLDVPVVGRTVAAGPARLVAWYETTLAAVGMCGPSPAAEVTAASALPVLARGWPWLRVVPAESPWVAHGRTATLVGVTLDKGVAVSPLTRGPYAILTDWDRMTANDGRTLWRKYT